LIGLQLVFPAFLAVSARRLRTNRRHQLKPTRAASLQTTTGSVCGDESNFSTRSSVFADWSKNTWRIDIAFGDQALEILKTHQFDLIVVDVNMPVVDGVQFLSISHPALSDLKKSRLTSLAREKRSACLANGADCSSKTAHGEG